LGIRASADVFLLASSPAQAEIRWPARGRLPARIFS
jgi:hypothetical protein